MRFDAVWLIALAAVALLLIGWSLQPWVGRRLVAFCLINGTLLVSLAWGTTERSELTVQVVGDRVLASLGEASLSADATDLPRGGVELTVSPVEERPQAARWAYDRPSWLDGVALWLVDGLRSGIGRMTISGWDGVGSDFATPTLWQAARRGESPIVEDPLVANWALRSDTAGRAALVSLDRDRRDYRITVELVRPGATVRLLVRADNRGNGLAVVAAPDQRTFAIEEQLAGQPARPVSGGLFAYKRDAAAWLQALTRELARPWLFGLVLVGLGRALTPATVGRSGTPPRPRLPAWVLPTVFGGSCFLATAAVAWFVLEGIPHVQDSVTYLFQAQLFAVGRLSAPAPALAEFFEQEFVVVHNGVWFGKYPPGAPLILTLGVLANAPWLMSPVMLGGAVALTYLSGRRLYGAGVAAVAAILMLTSPFLLLMGGDMMAHPSGLFWTSLILYATVRCIDGDGRLPWVVAGAAFGMLFLTRQLTAVSVAAPLLLALGLHSLRSPQTLPGRAGLFLLGDGPLIAFLLFFNWSLVGNPLRSPYELWWGFDRVGFGPTIGMHGPHDVANGLSNTWANTAELMRHLYGWPAYLTLAPSMVPLILVSRKLWDWVLAAGALSLAVAYVAYWADGIMYGPRYYFEAASMLALLTARGFAMLAALPSQVSTRSGPDWLATRRAAWLATAALLGALLAVNLLGYLPSVLSASRGFNGVSRTRLDLVGRAQVGRALVFVTQRGVDWQPYGSVFPANGPLLDGEVIFARDLGEAENARLIALHPDRQPYLLRGLELTRISP